jgi:hypothetical protein
MTYAITYELDYKRVMLAVINDSRNTIPAIAGQDGNAIYAYAQDQIALVVPGVLVYRVGSLDGNFGGYLALQVQNGVALPLLLQLRPAYQQNALEINGFIANFIVSGAWKADYLI